MMDDRYILLDQGAFRSAELRQRIAEDPNAYFVVPDVAFSEMAIKTDPILTITRSLESLKSAADRTFMSLSCGEIKGLQRTRAQLLLKDLLNGPGTKILRVLLEGDASPDYGAVIQRILETAPDHRKIYDGRQDKAVMVDHVAIFSRNLGTGGLRALRAGKIEEIEKLGIIIMIMTQMEKVGGRFETDVDMRLLLVRLARIMMWAEKQGLGNISPNKIMNDFIDMDFVVAGSFFDEIMTHDKTVKVLDGIMRSALDFEHAKRAVAAAMAIGFKVSA